MHCGRTSRSSGWRTASFSSAARHGAGSAERGRSCAASASCACLVRSGERFLRLRVEIRGRPGTTRELRRCFHAAFALRRFYLVSPRSVGASARLPSRAGLRRVGRVARLRRRLDRRHHRPRSRGLHHLPSLVLRHHRPWPDRQHLRQWRGLPHRRPVRRPRHSVQPRRRVRRRT